MSYVLVTGSGSGLGKELVIAMQRVGHNVIAFDHSEGDDVRRPGLLSEMIQRLDILINCAGVNKINYLENVAEEEWDEVMDVNAKGIFKMTQACLPMLKASRGTVVNIASNASHMPMTASLAYNASKAAAHIMTLQLARELTKRYGITVFGVAPNKLEKTGMSRDIEEQVVRTRGWTPEYAREYQLNALLTGEETPPELVAEFIAFLLSSKARHIFLSGCVIPYGA